MNPKEHGRVQSDIADAFDFVRFLLKNPRVLRKIKDGSEIAFLPAPSGKVPRPLHLPKKVQAFATETLYRTL